MEVKSIGIVLLVLGILALVYGGINYNKDRTILEVGSMNITATEHKSIPIPVLAGAAVLIGGVTLLLLGRRHSQTA